MGQFYMSQYEYIMFFRKGKARKINNCGTSDILNINNSNLFLEKYQLGTFTNGKVGIETTRINFFRFLEKPEVYGN